MSVLSDTIFHRLSNIFIVASVSEFLCNIFDHTDKFITFGEAACTATGIWIGSIHGIVIVMISFHAINVGTRYIVATPEFIVILLL
jgi:hypothetical protein